MDSHLIAGAYSQQFLSSQKDHLIDSARLEAVVRAKRLSQETNKRRKLQTLKRKLQAKREEKRRQEILARRREEQKEATEKYQRYHIPLSARQRHRYLERVPERTLDSALQLIRGNSHNSYFQPSQESRNLVQDQDSYEPNSSAFSQNSSASAQATYARLNRRLNKDEQNKLMIYSQQNLTASKSLFEQQLEHQQNVLLQQQQRSLQHFSNEVMSEIAGKDGGGGDEVEKCEDVEISQLENSEGTVTQSDSCYSLDSLDEHKFVTSGISTETEARRQSLATQEYLGSPGQQREGQSLQTKIQNSYTPYMSYKLGAKASICQSGKESTPTEELHNNKPGPEALKNDTLDSANVRAGVLQRVLFKEAHNDMNSFRRQDEDLFIRGRAREQQQEQQQQLYQQLQKQQYYQAPHKQISVDSLESVSSSSMKVSTIKQQDLGNDTRSALNVKSEDPEKYHTSAFAAFKMIKSNINEHDSDQLVSDLENTSFSRTPVTKVASVSSGSQENIAGGKDLNVENNSNESLHKNVTKFSSGVNTPLRPGSEAKFQLPASFPVTYGAHTVTYAGEAVKSTAVGTISGVSGKTETVAGVNLQYYGTVNPSSQFVSSYSFEQSPPFQREDTAMNDLVKDKKQNSTAPHMTYNGNHTQNNLNFQSGYSSKEMNNVQKENQVIKNQNTSANDSFHSKKIGAFPAASNFSVIGTPVSGYHEQNEQNKKTSGAVYQEQTSAKNPQVDYILESRSDSMFRVRKYDPLSRPPSPSLITETGVDPISMEKAPSVSDTNSNNQTTYSEPGRGWLSNAGSAVSEDVLTEDDSEQMRPLRGILKQGAVKGIPQNAAKVIARPFPRDSLELARNNDKAKKKSVRFANELNQEEDSLYGIGYNRPLSAKVTPVTSKPEVPTTGQRASSAPQRQQSNVSTHVHIRNVQQMSSSLAGPNNENSDLRYNYASDQRSLLTSANHNLMSSSALINRPKAAAHIIMNTESQKDMPQANNFAEVASLTLRKPDLDMKTTSVNKNFMSKVPVRTLANRDTNITAYNVAYKKNENDANNDPVYNASKTRNMVPSLKQSTDFTSEAKNDSFSPNAGDAVVKSIESNRKNISINGNGIFDGTGVRIDRTPTDEEITKLWDNVRNCLNRGGAEKTQALLGTNDQKPTPTLSTKLFDGASLGLGTPPNGVAGAFSSNRPGINMHQTTSAPGVQSGVQSGLQQQGSYLRRYNLLKQRRAYSASAIRSNVNLEHHRTASVGFDKTVSGQQKNTGQWQQHKIQTPSAFAYKPQDEVSESMAEFVMAEQLAKQSLSDSMIHRVLEDAHNKQKTSGNFKITRVPNGMTALSYEEQKLLESLDRLNERLKESNLNGTGSFFQSRPIQPSDFSTHRPIIDARQQNMTSTGTQQRPLSARLRQRLNQPRAN